MIGKNVATVILAAGLVFGISACTMHVDKTENGRDKNVDIRTPVGSLSVHKGANPKDTGIDLYANAKLKEGVNDEDSANVNIAGPGFGLKVVAATFTTDDSPEKVLGFYRDDFKRRFGSSLECKGNYGDVQVDKKGKDLNRPVSCESHKGASDTVELKAGTEGNQHIVAVKPDGKGTEFKLVYVRVSTADKKNSDDAI